MFSKKSEVELYSKMYIYAFDKDKSFFYNMESSEIYDFLCQEYWGEGLRLRTKLLAELLDCDSSVHPPKFRKELLKKSEELKKYLNNLNQNLK